MEIPSGACVLGVSFEKTGNDAQHSALGKLSLFINEKKVDEAEIKTQPGKFMLAGEGLNIGKDPGSPVSKTAYQAPFEFTGGTISEVIVDVSGEQYVNLELEALGMQKRD